MSVLTGRLSRFKHLSDETISRLISSELSPLRSITAKAHLERCWQCRSRREAFERAAMQVTDLRHRLVASTPRSPQRRELLLADLRRKADQTLPQPSFSRSVSNLAQWIGHRMSPIFTSAAIVMTAAVLLIWVWQRSASPVDTAEVLQRATASDAAVSQEKVGVIYQKVRITTSRSRIDYALYRDSRGVRRRRPEPATAEVESVRTLLSTLGVDLDAPLSAASYRQWHDHQDAVADEVHKGDDNLLTLRSKVPGNWIREETLTVRATDFHPVARTIETQSYGTIEIAEVSYAVLPWSGVNEALFEPLESAPHATPLRLPSVPTDMELDSAELSARVVLNQLHADEGEQINVTRTDHVVEVQGVVETDDRKREIVQQLRAVPHVRAEILSIAELQSLPRGEDAMHSITMQTVDGEPSPLARYLAAQGNEAATLDTTSQRLLDAALAIRQNANELTTISQKFSQATESDSADSMLADLTRSYTQRLTAGLDAEVGILRTLGFADTTQPSTVPAAFDLAAELDRNDSRCRELIAGSHGSTRPAEEIAAEMYQSVSAIRAASAAAYRPAAKKH